MITPRRPSLGWVLAILGYMAGLFYLSSLPGSATGPNTPFWRFVSNAFHIPLFAGLGFCLTMAFANWPWRSRALGTLGAGLAYAIFDEWHQIWSPGRSASFSDVMLDMVGVLLALWVLWALSRYLIAKPLHPSHPSLSPTGERIKVRGKRGVRG